MRVDKKMTFSEHMKQNWNVSWTHQLKFYFIEIKFAKDPNTKHYF